MLLTNEIAGAIAQENFNNLADLSANATPLIDSKGLPTPITISYGPVSQGSAATGDSDADHVLFHGYIHNNNNPMTITLSNVPPATNYSLLVYSVGGDLTASYEEAFTLTGQTSYPTLRVRGQDSSQYVAAPAYTRMSSTDPGARDLGNYVEFENVTPAADGTLVLLVNPEAINAGAGFLPPISALQLATNAPGLLPTSLSASYDAATHNLTVAWDASAAGYALVSSPSLGTNADWAHVLGTPNPITSAGSTNFNTSSGGEQFVRLVESRPLLIITQPQSQIVPSGAVNVSFSVIATGLPPILYQWTFNGSTILDATNSTYTIPHDVTFADVGDYQVLVTDDFVASLPAGLSVYSGGTLQTPISRFYASGGFNCGGVTFNRAYLPRDAANQPYLFYGDLLPRSQEAGFSRIQPMPLNSCWIRKVPTTRHQRQLSFRIILSPTIHI